MTTGKGGEELYKQKQALNVSYDSTVVIWSGPIGSREDHALLLGKDLRKDLVNPGPLG
jgi:hypothetical protein